jgi:hypothetical protein
LYESVEKFVQLLAKCETSETKKITVKCSRCLSAKKIPCVLSYMKAAVVNCK